MCSVFRSLLYLTPVKTCKSYKKLQTCQQSIIFPYRTSQITENEEIFRTNKHLTQTTVRNITQLSPRLLNFYFGTVCSAATFPSFFQKMLVNVVSYSE